VLEAFRARAVRVVTVSNVDNLGARVDPVVVGAHLLAGRPLTAEVARKEGDMGGAPVRVDGRLQLLEGPRFPPSFDQDLVPVFNTNTAVFALDALDREYDLTWLYVEKQVDGRTAVQLERVYHEVSSSVATTYLEVPRRGPRGRFLPIKTPDDLASAQDDLRDLLAAPAV
jgi:UTP--glucose-1-phosphate uridylyltransferase